MESISYINLTTFLRIRQPPYHPNLNMIEFVWRNGEKSCPKNFTNRMINSIQVCKDKIEAIIKEEWIKFCNKVKHTEEEFYEKELKRQRGAS